MQNFLLFGEDAFNHKTAIAKKHVAGLFIDTEDLEQRTLSIWTDGGQSFTVRYADSDTCRETFNMIIKEMNKEPL